MIKRLLFAARGDISQEGFASAWHDAVAATADAPPQARPVRIALCTVMPEVIPDPVYDGIGIEWFADADQLRRYEAWSAASHLPQILARCVDLHRSPVVIADEHVMRGVEWLEQRWRDGGEKLKHMALARRAAGLTLKAFFERWQSRAGKVGTAVIPDEARGLAYVQNHPLLSGEDWAYDAVNEVYFDEVEGLRTRIAYFQESLGAQSEDDLVSANWFMAVREEVLLNTGK